MSRMNSDEEHLPKLLHHRERLCGNVRRGTETGRAEDGEGEPEGR